MKQTISKLLLILFILFSTVLSGCTPNTNKDLLNYPELRWGMDVDEVIAALSLADSDYTYTPSKAGAQTGGYLNISSVKLFGSMTEKVIFYFGEPAISAFHSPRLSAVSIFYPDDCNMSTVKQELEQEFGISNQVFTHHPLGTITVSDTELPCINYPADDFNCYWISDIHISDYLGEEATAQYIVDFSTAQNISESLYSQYVNVCPVTYIHWASNYGNDLNTSEVKNFVHFSSKCAQLDGFLALISE